VSEKERCEKVDNPEDGREMIVPFMKYGEYNTTSAPKDGIEKRDDVEMLWRCPSICGAW
jgi:hypothetical protein